MKKNIYTIYPRGYAINYKEKDKRSLEWSEFQFTAYYIKKGETVSLRVLGSPNKKLFAYIGLPSDNKPLSNYLLVTGDNDFTAKNDGILSFKNHNDGDEKLSVFIKKEHQKIPSFTLYEDSNSAWNEEMAEYKDAPYVILSNELSDIIVTYKNAKKYIVNPQKLMEDYNLIIEKENEASGYIKNGKADYKQDPNKCLHLEVNTGYMYAANGFTGYNEATGAMPALLGVRSNDRFGIWHENGHQRQQHPWQWSKGTGLTEVTTNIYSLYVEEAIEGKALHHEEYYPEMKTFIDKNETKSYDDLDLFIKLGLFWQLKLTFGEAFYPQLHQIYRLMINTPSGDQVHEQKQLFIRTTSALTNTNLIPFFTKWGIYADLRTMSHLSFLPKLTLPIWENTTDQYHKLPMPIPKYIPELTYFKNSVNNVVLSNKKISFTLDAQWYKPYKFMFFLNGKYIGEVNNGIAYYCSGHLNGDTYHVSINITDEVSINGMQENDIFSIDAYYEGVHEIYNATINLNNLWEDVTNLYSDEALFLLKNEVTQVDIDNVWLKHNNCKNSSALSNEAGNKISLAQHLFLIKTIENEKRDNKEHTLEFSPLALNNYLYTISSSGNILNKVQLSGSDSLILKTPLSEEHISIEVTANIYNQDFIIRKGFIDDFILKEKIDSLYSDKENGILNESIEQKDIDNLISSIQGSHVPEWKKIELLSYLDKVQKIFLVNTMTTSYLSNNTVYVTFTDNERYKDYRYMLWSGNKYLSEITYGRHYYSSRDGLVWKTVIEPENTKFLHIEAYANEKWYTLCEISD